MTTNVLDSTVRRCFVRLCYEAATPFAYKMLRHLKNEEWYHLVASAPDPRKYTDARTYQADAVVGCFFKKYSDLDLGLDLKAQAVKSFYDNEASCYRANERLSPFLHRGFTAQEEGAFGFINLVRKEVSLILGRLPASLEGKFGPGSTFGDRGKYTTLPDKMSTRPTLTSGAQSFMPLWEQTAWARFGCNRLNSFPDSPRFSPEEVRGNRFTTVPKDALKHRGICIEPSLNLFYQLGLGGVIRRKLRDSGIDLLTAQHYHRELARKGSIDGSVATIDLSNASDTISINLVRLLLPNEWFETLSSLRSVNTFVGGRWVRLEKFSSMGNGYTFELETLIFLSIARAVRQWLALRDGPLLDTENIISVYGDDIIVPSDQASDVIRALNFFGLSVNESKTFLAGGFRESCGGDYFGGLDVRPYFLKNSPNEPQQFIALANGLYRNGKNAHRIGDDGYPYHSAWLSCVDALPTAVRACKGPEQLGDIVLHQEEHRWIQNRRERSGIHYIRAYKPVRPRRIGWDHFRPGVVFASALFGSGDGTSGSGVDERKFIDTGGVFPRQTDLLSYRLGWVAQS